MRKFVPLLLLWLASLNPALAETPMMDLIRERLRLSAEVAAAKWTTGRPIDDPVREQQLLSRLVADRPSNLSEVEVRDFFAAQIEASKMVQRRLYARWREGGGPWFGPTHTLEELRPRLDRVSQEMLRELGEGIGEVPPTEDPALQKALTPFEEAE